jgi:4-amino-4-deoxychorismate lyase
VSIDDTLFLRIDGVDAVSGAGTVSAADRGLAYGDGVFRTVRMACARVPAWTRHARKLDADCRRLGLPAPDHAAIERDLADIGLRHSDCTVRITITAGASARGYRRSDGARPTLIVRASPVPAWPERFRTDGIALHLCSLRLASQPALAGIKHLNRLEQVLARSEWSDPAVPEGLTLDQAGGAICGTMSNLFILEAGRLVTPDLTACGVAGVQRERILDWAAASSIEARIEPVPLARLLAADALLLSNSVIGAWWAASLRGRRFASPAWYPELCASLGRDD